MVTNKTVKFFTSKNNNAPQLQNAHGSMLALLDACLVSGIQVGVVVSLTASGSTATVNFGVTHNLIKHQVIRISGANQVEFNGDFKITQIANESTVKFDLGAVATVANATGTINCMLAPLGFEKPFSSTTALGGGRAAFRSKDESVPNRPFLRVVDERISNYNINFAKYAKVGIVENMTDIDTMSGVQAPYIASAATRNWNPTGSGVSIKNGWAKWYYFTPGEYYSDSASFLDYPSENRTWTVVGTESAFYILNSSDNQQSTAEEQKELAFCYGFGSFDPISDDDLFPNFLLATNMWVDAQSAVYRVDNGTRDVIVGTDDPGASYASGVFLQRGYKKSVYAQASCSKVSLDRGFAVSGNSDINTSGSDVFGGVILQTPIILEILTSGQFQPRGFLPLIKTIPHKVMYSDLQMVEQGNSIFLSKHVRGTLGNSIGIVLFDLGG